MMMKKLFVLLLSLLILVSFTVALAANPPEAKQGEEDALCQRYKAMGYVEVFRPSTPEEVKAKLDVDPTVIELAYTDLDSASPELQEAILAARREIIYSASWYVDNGFISSAVRMDPEKGEFSRTPEFSELFPGWDVPTEPAVLEN